jgi:hypothetical protein
MSFIATAIAGGGGSALGGALIGAGSLASGALGYFGATSAANAQVNAESAALAAQNQARSKLDPWINVGTGANYTLGSLYGIGSTGQPAPSRFTNDFSTFTNSPDFQFAQQQGTLGLQRYENAAGLALSGGALKDVAQFNQGLASQQYGNYFNRLMQISQMGQGAATAGVSGANAAAQTMGAIGQSTASGIIGGTNAITGGINSGISNSLMYQGVQNQANYNSLFQAAMNRSSYANPGNPLQLGPYAPTPFASAGTISGGLQ